MTQRLKPATRALLAAAFVLAFASAAAAREVPAWAPAGQVPQARASAEVVIVIAVDRVRVENNSCVVTGRVAAVERGADIRLQTLRSGASTRLGDRVEQHLPCGPRSASSIRRYADPVAVQRSRRARLWFYASDGALIDYQPL